MASPTTIKVVATSAPGDWKVMIGRRNHSHHNLKKAAMKEARKEGRKRADQPGGAILKSQNRHGHWKTEATYGR